MTMFADLPIHDINTRQVDREVMTHVSAMIDLLGERGQIKDVPRFKRLLEVNLSWAKNRTRSNGGLKLDRKTRKKTPVISIAMRRCVREAHDNYVSEYKSFARDPVIGATSVANTTQAALVAVAHELAHVVQFCRDNMEWPGLEGLVSDRLPENTRPHGYLFTTVYRALRQGYVNHFLGEPEEVVSKMAASSEPVESGSADSTGSDPVVTTSFKSRAALVRYMIEIGENDDRIVAEAQAKFPKVKTGVKEVKWYRWKMRQG